MITSSDILHGKVLIVDDKEINVLLLERILRGAGYVSITSTMDAECGAISGVIGSLLRERPSTSTVRALCGHVACFRRTAVPNRSKRRRPVCRPTSLQGEHKIMRGRDYFYETARQCLVGYRRSGGRGGCGRQFHAPRSRVPPVANVRSKAPTEKYQEPPL